MSLPPSGMSSPRASRRRTPLMLPQLLCVCVCVCVCVCACVCVCVCDSFFLLSLFVTLYIFLHLTVMHSSTFGKGWVGMSACPLVVLACESLHVCTVCIWRCEHARFCVEVFYALYINFHSFIHSSWMGWRGNN